MIGSIFSLWLSSGMSLRLIDWLIIPFREVSFVSFFLLSTSNVGGRIRDLWSFGLGVWLFGGMVFVGETGLISVFATLSV